MEDEVRRKVTGLGYDPEGGHDTDSVVELIVDLVNAERNAWREAWVVAMEVVDGYAGDPPKVAYEKLKHLRGDFDTR